MFGRKGYSARMSKRTSRRMQNATLGTHVVRQAASSNARTSVDSVSLYESARSGRTTERTASRTPTPRVTSNTPSLQYYQRANYGQSRYVEQIRRRTRRRHIVVGVIVALVIVAFAIGVGAFVYLNTIGANMALRNSDAKEALSAPASGEPYYVLLTTELGAAAVPLDSAGPDMIMLALIDEQRGELSLVNIPSNLYVSTTDNRRMLLGELGAESDKMLIEAIERFAEVDISHFVKVDEEGFVGIVDALGGIEVALAEEVDDPHAGAYYLPAGRQKLDGAKALVFLRSQNLRQGEQARLTNQLAFSAALLSRLFEANGTLGFAARLDSLGGFMQTDLSSNDAVSLGGKFQGISADSIVQVTVPGYTAADTSAGAGDSSVMHRYVATADDMRALIASIEHGEIPSFDDKPDTSSIDPASFTIEVQNGANIMGAAASTQATLSSLGFNVIAVGNAEQPVYTETLVIAKGDDAYLRAHKVIEALGLGRMVEMAYYYEFNADVLVILGSDFKPLG